MRLSPPITILALLGACFVSIVWLAPPPREPAQVAVHISTATYEKLAAWGRDQAGPAGDSLTVAQAIEVLADQTGED